MTLPISPAEISAGLVNLELGLASTAPLGFNDPAVRGLAGKPTPSSLISLADLYGKSRVSSASSIVSQIWGSTAERNKFISNFMLSGFETGLSLDITNHHGGNRYDNPVLYNNSALNFSGMASTPAGNTTHTTIVLQAAGYQEHSHAHSLTINGVSRPLATVGSYDGFYGGSRGYYRTKITYAVIPMPVTAITSMSISIAKHGNQYHGSTQEFFIIPGNWTPAYSNGDVGGVIDGTNYSYAIPVEANDIALVSSNYDYDGGTNLSVTLGGVSNTEILRRNTWWYCGNVTQLRKINAAGTLSVNPWTTYYPAAWSGGKEGSEIPAFTAARPKTTVIFRHA